MGCTAEAVKYLNSQITFAPGKAANAGGVAVSGLEMSQNSMRYSWTAEEVDQKLSQIMKDIHDTCVKFGKPETRSTTLKVQTSVVLLKLLRLCALRDTYKSHFFISKGKTCPAFGRTGFLFTIKLKSRKVEGVKKFYYFRTIIKEQNKRHVY